MNRKTCPNCATQFKPIHATGTFCSRNCVNEYSEQLSLERFYMHVHKTDFCWLWTGAIGQHGYGFATLNRRHLLAHRASWIIAHGPIPNGKCVLHKCDVKICVRPDHLFLGTQQDNVTDAIQKGRWPDQKGESNPAHKLCEKDVLEIRKLHALGLTTSQIFQAFDNVTYPSVRNVIAGRTWKHVV